MSRLWSMPPGVIGLQSVAESASYRPVGGFLRSGGGLGAACQDGDRGGDGEDGLAHASSCIGVEGRGANEEMRACGESRPGAPRMLCEGTDPEPRMTSNRAEWGHPGASSFSLSRS